METSSGLHLHIVYTDDYPSVIESVGQTPAQLPQLMQVSASIEYLSPSEIASTGQTGAQVPHAMQVSPITYAIINFNFLEL
jgi:hypothetical protein